MPRDGSFRGPYFPPPPATPRLQYLTYFSSSREITRRRGVFSRLVFGESQASDELVKPYGIAIYKGVLYVCDTKRNLINIFDLNQHRFGYLGFQGRGKLEKPINLTIDERGYKYVADAERGEIVVFDDADAYVGSFGGEELTRPVDIAVTGTRIYACDAQTCEIVVFDRSTNRFLSRFGGKGTGKGRFARPTNIDIDEQGNLYISDTINGRVQRCDPEGGHLLTIGGLGDGPGRFARPKGIALDREGRLYVVDAAFENVQVFDPDGRLLLFFSEAGNAPGQLNLPAQVIVDYDNVSYFERFAGDDFDIEYLVIVTSQYGPRKINVFGFGRYVGKQ